MKTLKEINELGEDELDKLIKDAESSLPPEIIAMVDACCKNRDELLGKTQEIVSRLSKTLSVLEGSAIPRLEETENEPALRGAYKMFSLLKDTKELIHELVTTLAQADAVAQGMLMIQNPDLQ